MLDVLVVGAGPAGSNITFNLARAGLNVKLIDIKETVGVPNHCSGLVEKRVVDLIGEDVVIDKPEVAEVETPAGSFSLRSERMYVLDRVAVDSKLAEKAISEGASFSRKTRLLDFKMENSSVKVHLKSNKGFESLESRFIIGADGPMSTVRRVLKVRPPRLLTSLQFDVKNNSDRIKIILDRKKTPDFFSWQIPAGEETEIGASGKGSESAVRKLAKGHEILRKRGGLVPVGPTSLGSGRGFLVGDAAGLSKATTGGGLFSALSSGNALAEAVRRDEEVLSTYERIWFSGFGKEILRSYKIRTFLDRYEKYYSLWVPIVKSNISGINRVGDVDYPSKTLLYITGASLLKFPFALRKIVST